MLRGAARVWLGEEGGEAETQLRRDRRQDAGRVRSAGPSRASPDIGPELRAALEEIDSYLADRVPPLMAADSVARAGARRRSRGRRPRSGPGPLQPGGAEGGPAPRGPPLPRPAQAERHGGVQAGRRRRCSSPSCARWARRWPRRAPRPRADRLRRGARPPRRVRDGPQRSRGGLPPPRGARARGGPRPPRRHPSCAGCRCSSSGCGGRASGAGAAASPARRRLVSQALTVAATQATSERELEGHLRRLRAAGVASGAEHIFRSLGEGLPDWAVPKGLASDTADLPPAGEVKAMRQIVSLPEDPLEVARRFRHLVNAATEQFNEGNLGGAVQMFGLASALVAEKKIDKGFVDPIRARGHEALDQVRLRQYMERSDRHPQLQAVMSLLRGRSRGRDPPRPARGRGATGAAAPAPRSPGRAGRGRAGPRPRAAARLARDPGHRVRAAQLDLPPAPRPPPGRGGRGAGDRRRRPLRRPREPELPGEGGRDLPGPDPPPPHGPGPRGPAARVGDGAVERGGRHGRGRRRGARPHRRGPGPAGQPEGLARARRPRAVAAAGAGRDGRTPRRAGQPGPLVEPGDHGTPAGRDPGEPPPRRPGPAGGAARPGPARARRGARGHPRAAR